MAKKPNVSLITIGDFVRLNDAYFKEWTTLNPQVQNNIRDTIFIVMDEIHSTIFPEVILFTLKAVAGKFLRNTSDIICRAEKDLELLKPEDVDLALKNLIEETFVEK